MQRAAIELEDIEFAWPGQRSLLRIDALRIARGERVLLTGPSGCGKSTLLGLVGGVIVPQRGSVTILGSRLGDMRAGERDRFRGDHVGFVFQSFNLLPYLDVEANLRLALRFSGKRRSRMRLAGAEQEMKRLFVALGLDDPSLSGRPVRQLSVGQQQRAAAARALFGAPEILIADEPTSSLDDASGAEFLDLLFAECARLGSTVLMVSHDRRLASLFDRSLDGVCLRGASDMEKPCAAR